MSKIEQTIAEMEDFIDNCKLQPLSNSKIIVNKNELEEYIEELKANIPDEIKKYQRIIANRDAILKDAQDKAEEMIKKANEMTVQLVSEHEIMQQAYKEANSVVQDAHAEADAIMSKTVSESNALKTATNQYLDDALASIQNILNTSIEGLNVKYDSLLRSLESSLEVTTKNRKTFQQNQAAIDASVKQEPAAEN
ncbi:MAG: vacuolar family H+-ATPase subunit H [Lachnospiraceae bacterium]|nr:vacuolar family H+-ATPase subunit H [Lachnospiraceae bacterium]